MSEGDSSGSSGKREGARDIGVEEKQRKEWRKREGSRKEGE